MPGNQSHPDGGNGRRFLLVKVGAIGDVIMTLPLVPFLRDRYPGCHITWVCGRAVVPLMELFGGPDERVVVDEAALLAGSPVARLRALWGIWRRIAGRSYDRVITPYYDRRYRLLSLPVRARERVAWTRLTARPLPVMGRYRGDECLRMAGNPDGPAAVAARLPRAHVELPPHLQARLDGCAAPRVALAPGGGASNTQGGGNLRRWPLESYVALAERLSQQGHSVIVVGAPSDAWVCEAFAHLPVVDLVGQTSLVELIGVFEQCQAAAMHDQGPMHLAMTTGIPLMALFGPSVPSDHLPSGANVRVFWGGADLPCRPCCDGKYYGDCRDSQCMRGITVDEVAQAVADAAACGVAVQSDGAGRPATR